jgi:hypothetical protein
MKAVDICDVDRPEKTGGKRTRRTIIIAVRVDDLAPVPPDHLPEFENMAHQPALCREADGARRNPGIQALLIEKIVRFADDQHVMLARLQCLCQFQHVELPTTVNIGRICQ